MASSQDSGVPPSQSPWPTMRGDRQNTGRSPLFARLGPGTSAVSNLQTKSFAALNATPVIGPGERVLVGSADNSFYDFIPGQGEQHAVATGNIIDSAAAIAGPDEVYFASGNFQIWKYDPSSGQGVVAIDPGSAEVWSPSTIRWFEGNIVRSGKGLLYAGCDNYYMYCLDPSAVAGRQVRWAFPTGFFIWSAPAFASDEKAIFFASADMTLYSLPAENVDPLGLFPLWAAPLGNLCASSPAVHATLANGTMTDVAVLVGCFDGKLYAFAPGTGAPLWTYQTGSLIYASPAVATDGTVYIASSDGVLRALRPPPAGSADGSLLWEFFLGQPSFCSVAIGPDPEGKAPYLMYVGGGNGEIFAIDPAGNRRWSYATYNLVEKDDGAGPDPAYWQTFSAPAINSSIATGMDGVATATSAGNIVHVGYRAYLGESPGFDRSPEDDYFAQLAAGPRFYYLAPGGALAASPTGSGERGNLYPADLVSLRALGRVRSNGVERSGFAPFDPSSVSVTVRAGGQELRPPLYFSVDRTAIHVPPSFDFFLTSGQEVTYEVKASVGGQPVAETLSVGLRPIASPAPPTALASHDFTITNMAISTPFALPALDQVGIASIEIQMTVLAIDPSDGHFLAYAFENFSASGGASQPRILRYLFRGRYSGGSFLMESRNCYFELSGIPLYLGCWRLSGYWSGEQPTGLSMFLEARYGIENVCQFLDDYITYWRSSFNLPTTVVQVAQAADILARSVRLLEQTVERRLWKPWRLLDDENSLAAVGTYQISASEKPEPSWSLTSVTVQLEQGFLTNTVLATVSLTSKEPGSFPVPGIVARDASGHPLPLDYSALAVDPPPPPAGAWTFTAALDVPKDVLYPIHVWTMLDLRAVDERDLS